MILIQDMLHPKCPKTNLKYWCTALVRVHVFIDLDVFLVVILKSLCMMNFKKYKIVLMYLY